MFNVVGGELILLVILIVIILGPQKLPEYAGKLRDFTIRMRDLAKGASTQLKEEMGPAFDEVDWKQLDPRQYDPRRIVRDALSTPADGQSGAVAADDVSGEGAAPGGTYAPRPRQRRGAAGAGDPSLPTPYDHEAT